MKGKASRKEEQAETIWKELTIKRIKKIKSEKSLRLIYLFASNMNE